MPVDAKICGLNDPAAVDAAVRHGAAMIGFVFYPPSPRAVAAEAAAALARPVPDRIARVAVFVDAQDAAIAAVVRVLRPGLLQLHGAETPARVAAIRQAFNLPVMKAIKIATAGDVAAAEPYFPVADRLLFDAKPLPERTDALPGGNALSFDWRLLAGHVWPLPWLLSGGLDAHNVALAARLTGAQMVDVSSGVEERPGRKDPERIRTFLAACHIG